ncbi:MAG: helix-turn-helix domain-containing protein [Lachnospiraceae bacterium]|nr:helix-turn-helix domain-containing protein [Muribaculaceae bacterium]MCM1409703.1 helix-turn-helix domain-containing protein [Lachnospiraceae bacterium]
MYKECFHERVKKARQGAGYTQKQVEAKTGISQPIIAYIENGKREPSLENLGILADLYEVSIDWLLGRGEKRTE